MSAIVVMIIASLLVASGFLAAFFWAVRSGQPLAEVLRKDEGNLVEIEEGDQGQFLMRRHNCSFFSMFEDSRTVCYVDEEMLTKIIGTRVKRTASRHDGAPCCIFEIVADK